MKKMKLFLVGLVGLLSFGLVGVTYAAETTTETQQEETQIVEDEIFVVSEDGEYDFTNNWELAREEVQEIYYEDWSKVDLDTLTIYFDGKIVMEDGVMSNDLVDPVMLRYDTEQYKNYPKLFDFSYMEDVDGDGEIDFIYQITIAKDGTGEFYKADVNIEKHVGTELRIVFDKEVVAETAPVVVPDEGFNYDSLNELWTSIISWVGGISGLAALGMYGLRAWRERKTIGAIRTMVADLKGEKTEDATTVKQLKNVIGEFSVREERLEKVVISLIGLSNVTPEAKQEILKSIESPDVKISELLANKVEMIKQEVASKTEQEQEIVKETKSLLSKLAEKKE